MVDKLNSVSVIISTFNRDNLLKKLLHSLAKQSINSDKYIIYVVDNASIDNTAGVVREACSNHPKHNIKYIFEPVPGLLATRHRGALESDSDVLVFIDDDIEPVPGWMEAIISAFSEESVQLVGGKNLPKFEVEPPKWIEAFWATTPFGGKACSYLSLLDLGNKQIDIDANYIWGLNFAIRKKALFELDGFHPDIVPKDLQKFQGDGETGLTIKANSRQFRAIYEPNALVYHRIPAYRLSVEYFEKRAYYQGVCDSYTDLKRIEGLNKLSNIEVDNLNNFLIQHIKNRILYFKRLSGQFKDRKVFNYKTVQIRKRVLKSYRSGYLFHQHSVRNDNELLEWVLRKNYWDYHYPE